MTIATPWCGTDASIYPAVSCNSAGCDEPGQASPEEADSMPELRDCLSLHDAVQQSCVLDIPVQLP